MKSQAGFAHCLAISSHWVDDRPLSRLHDAHQLSPASIHGHRREGSRKGNPLRRQQLAAIVALIVGTATIVFAMANAVSVFPRGLVVLALVLVAGACAWYGVLRRGVARVAGVGVAGLALVGVVAVIVVDGARFADLLILAGLLVSLAASRAAFAIHVDLPRVPAPSQAVLFFNPKSGGGKAERFKLADEARARGIEPIELGPPLGPRGARPRRDRARRRRAGDGRR